MLLEALEVSQVDHQMILTPLRLMRQQPVIHSQIFPSEIFEEGLEEMLEVGIGALNQHARLVLVVDVLIHKVNSLPVHL